MKLQKILKAFSIVVIILFVLSIFGWMVFHISQGDKKFGFLTEPIKFMYTFPDLFSQSVEEVKTLPQTFIPTPENFQPINKLEEDLIVISTHSDTNDTRSMVLLNLRNDSILYKWNVDNPYQEHDRIWNPLLFDNKELIFGFECITGLQRIDSLSNVIWEQDSFFTHHAMNLDVNGNIWACTFQPVFYATGKYKLDGREVFYMDNYLTKIDANTGKILFQKSVTDILKENDLENYVLKSMNLKDPIHINDIQPALKSTKYYDKDDLFISIRNFSVVLHYRSSTNEVIDIIEGPFISQHDVDLTDTTLVFFNNNYYTIASNDSKEPPKDTTRLKTLGDFYSNIIQYNMENKSFSFIGDSIFRANKIFTQSEGLVEFINQNTYFVEEQNSGILWVIMDDKVIYKNVLKSQHEGYHHLPNWIRIIKDYD